ncbi:MAG: autotransporter domain-containing protein [Sphingomonadales bacterium]
MKTKLILATMLASSAMLPGAAFAQIVNPGFETGTTTGWTTSGGKWVTSAYPPPASDYSGPASLLSIQSGGTDAITGDPTVFSGNYSVKLNNSAGGNDITAISQVFRGYNSPDLYFAWNAVLEPSHGPTDSSSFYFQVTDLTTNTLVSAIGYSAYSAQGNSLFRTAGKFVTSDWRVEKISVTSGDIYEIKLLATDCFYGAHGGYVYLDAFGSAIPIPNAGVTFNAATDVTQGALLTLPVTPPAPVIPDIDTAVSSYTTTQLGAGQVNPNFTGGTLLVDAAGTYTTNFTIQSQGGTIDTNGLNAQFSGNFSGVGSLTKAGAGTLLLSTANSYSGGTYVNAGTIVMGDAAAFGTGAVSLGSGTILAPGANNMVLNNSLSIGNAAIDTSSNVFTVNSPISGTGNLTKLGSGALVLNAANSYSGGTTVVAGTVTVANNAALGTGAVAMGSGTILASGANNLALANGFRIDNTTVDTGTNTMTLSGAISGTGLLTKTGTGTLVLGGANSYSGGTALTAGTLQVNSNTALGTGALAMTNGTSLVAGANNLVLGNAISAAGYVNFDTGSFTTTLNGAVSGAAKISKLGAGTLVLNGTNTNRSYITLVAGTIRVGSNAALGADPLLMNNGTTLQAGAAGLTLSSGILVAGTGTVDVRGQVLTLSGNVFGSGALAVIDSAAAAGDALILTGSNSYAGGTTVTGTTLQIGADANLGAPAGGVTLQAATLRTTATMATARTIALSAVGGSVDVASGTTLTSTGIISGSSLTKLGAGTLVLNAANSYAAGTTLTAGTIQVGSNAALGAGALTMAGGTTLVAGTTGLTTANAVVTQGIGTVDTGTNSYSLSGVVSGAGSLVKQGSGILTLSGASTYTGATTVAAGTLNVTGSGTSAVTVASGATLNGTGTLGALTVAAGGAVSPGAPGTANVATLTVTGAASLAGSYTVNIVGTTNDRISAGGAMTVGGTLAVAPTGAFATFNQVYTVASGATRTGSFGTVTGLDQFGIMFAPVVEYTSTQANIRLAPQSLEVLGNRFGGISGNALEAARAFDRAVAGGYNPQAFFNVYASAASGTLGFTMLQMSGEQRATERRALMDSTRLIRETAMDRLNLGLAAVAGQQVSTNDGDRQFTFWLRGAGSWGATKAGGAATGFHTQQAGVLTGVDMTQDKLTLGGMFHYITTNIDFDVMGGSSTVGSVGGSLYAGYRGDSGPVFNGGISLAGTRSTGARPISLASFAQSLTGTTVGNLAQGFLEVAWDVAKSANTKIEPFGRLAVIRASSNALAESGGVAALSAGKQSYNLTVTNLGLRGVTMAGKYALHGSASWQQTTGDTEAATLIGIPAVGQQAMIRSVPIDRNALNLQVGASRMLTQTIRVSIDYSGLYGSTTTDHAARATLNIAF